MANEIQNDVVIMRERLTAFVEAYRSVKTALENFGLLGYLPNGETPPETAITDEDVASLGLTAAQVYAGVDALVAMAGVNLTDAQNKALARMMVRR